MAKASAQKFIARNRAPRVQIEYDVELYGSSKKVNLPFIMGVMADLSGKNSTELPDVKDRKFLEIDMDNFDDRLKSMKPKVAFAVPNVLSDQGGNLSVDITFESMEDFSPANVAKKVDSLRKLLERTQLENLKSYMDGKSKAEDLLQKVLKDPALLKTLGETPNPDKPA